MATLSVRTIGAALVTLCIAVPGCKPSAKVTRATPVANLQSYKTVLVRAAGSPRVPANAFTYLEQGAAHYIRQKCAFSNIVVSSQGGGQSDLVIDLNIRNLAAGGSGLIQVQNKVVASVALVLSDGINDELLGSAEIQGDSGGMVINNAIPEDQALDAVAKTIGDLMHNSGCALPRVARAPEPPPQNNNNADPNGNNSDPDGNGGNNTDPNGNGGNNGGGEDAQKREQAEASNDAGKKFFRAADPASAAQKFQEAVDLIPDPKYYFNLCLAHEAMKQFDAAIKACKKVSAQNGASERLVKKATDRIGIINDKR